jgi:hypothetical protein
MTIRHTCGCTSRRGCPLGALLFRSERAIALASHLEETMVVDRLALAPKSGGQIGQALAELRQRNNARARGGAS